MIADTTPEKAECLTLIHQSLQPLANSKSSKTVFTVVEKGLHFEFIN